MAAAATFEFAANGLQPRSGSPGAANASWVATVTGTDITERRVDAESQLVERCLSGDEAAWDELVRAYTRRVYAVCYRFTGKDGEAQDLTQEVFLRVFRTLKSFR